MRALEESSALRESLPSNLSSLLGSALPGDERKRNFAARDAFVEKIGDLIAQEVLPRLPLDDAADVLTISFLKDRHVPPPCEEDVESPDDFTTNTRLKPRAPRDVCHIVRSQAADGEPTLVLYHCCRNTRRFQEVDERGIEFEHADEAALRFILAAKSAFALKDVPADSMEDRVRVVSILIEERILRALPETVTASDA